MSWPSISCHCSLAGSPGAITLTKSDCSASNHPIRCVGWRRRISSATEPVTTTTAPTNALNQPWYCTTTAAMPSAGSGTAKSHVLFIPTV